VQDLVPSHPKIYHITHVNNLQSIARRGELISDAKRISSGLVCSLVGMSSIKKRRLEDIEVKCHPKTMVGEYVPFYFCPRSIMLYILHKGNHPEITYREGQELIVHLQSDLSTVIDWANSHGVRWAFSDGNAGSYLTRFFKDPSDLSQIDWTSVVASDWRDSRIKERKQAEFLAFDVFPWTLVEKIGTINMRIAERVHEALRGIQHKPLTVPEPSWYY